MCETSAIFNDFSEIRFPKVQKKTTNGRPILTQHDRKWWKTVVTWHREKRSSSLRHDWSQDQNQVSGSKLDQETPSSHQNKSTRTRQKTSEDEEVSLFTLISNRLTSQWQLCPIIDYWSIIWSILSELLRIRTRFKDLQREVSDYSVYNVSDVCVLTTSSNVSHVTFRLFMATFHRSLHDFPSIFSYHVTSSSFTFKATAALHFISYFICNGWNGFTTLWSVDAPSSDQTAGAQTLCMMGNYWNPKSRRHADETREAQKRRHATSSVCS